MEITRLSLGKIKTFIQCPLKYKLGYIDQAPAEEKASAGLSFYKSLHTALEYFHKEGISPLPSLDFLMNLLKRNWDSSGYQNETEERQHRELAENILREFYHSFAEDIPPVKYLGVLISFNTKKAKVSSRIDRVDQLPDGTYEVINYKTGKSVIEAPQLAEDLQAAVLYQGGNSHKRLEGKVSKVSFYFLRHNRKVSVTPNAANIKAAAAKIDQTVDNIKHLSKGSGVLTKLILKSDLATPANLAEKGPLCSTCEFLYVCPAWPVTPREIADESPEVFGKRIRLSYSKLSSYKRCPRAWKKSYLDGKFSQEPRPFFSFGTAMHEAFENFYDPQGKKKSSLKYLLKLWENAFNNYPEGYRDKEEADKYYQKGVEMLEKYHRHFVADGKYRPAYSIEEYFEVPLGKNAVMTGFIDRIDRLSDDEYEVLDYKTEPTRRKQQAVDEDDQLTIYFWACETMFKLKIKQLSLLMLNFDEKMVTTRLAEDIPQMVAAIDTTAAEMKENIRKHQEEHEASEEECVYFPPRKNKYCKSCDFLETCSLKPEIMGDTSLRTMEYVDGEETVSKAAAEYE